MKKSLLIILAAAILIAIEGGNIIYKIYWQKPAADTPVVLFEVGDGEQLSHVIKRLQEQRLLKDVWLFKQYLKISKLDTKILAGIIEVKEGMSLRALSGALTDAALAEKIIKLQEGWNLSDYGHYLEYNGLAMAEELHELAGFPAVDYRNNKEMPAPKDFSNHFDFLNDKPKYVGLEGYLFPDTYRIGKQAKVEEIAVKLLETFGKKLTPELRAEIARQKKLIFEIVTMASLVEAEAKNETDRRLVSDILWRRLDIGMALQLDSTVNYVTGAKKPAISLEEQETKSLYNTYKYPGLPLGPIDNPGLQSILAAIYPEKNDYWFFLSDKDGVTHYAKNLKEHNENKVKYLK